MTPLYRGETESNSAEGLITIMQLGRGQSRGPRSGFLALMLAQPLSSKHESTSFQNRDLSSTRRTLQLSLLPTQTLFARPSLVADGNGEVSGLLLPRCHG